MVSTDGKKYGWFARNAHRFLLLLGLSLVIYATTRNISGAALGILLASSTFLVLAGAILPHLRSGVKAGPSGLAGELDGLLGHDQVMVITPTEPAGSPDECMPPRVPHPSRTVDALIREAEELGWQIKPGGHHHLLISPDGQTKVALPKTARFAETAVDRIRRIMEDAETEPVADHWVAFPWF